MSVIATEEDAIKPYLLACLLACLLERKKASTFWVKFVKASFTFLLSAHNTADTARNIGDR